MYQGFGSEYGASPYSQMGSFGLGQSPYSQMSAMSPYGQSSLSQLGGNDLYSDRTAPSSSRYQNPIAGLLSQGLKSTQNEDFHPLFVFPFNTSNRRSNSIISNQ